MKIAIRVAGSQHEIWNQVAAAQDKLSSVAGSVRAAASPSSYMLSLETARLQESVDPYLHALVGGPSGQPDVIGYAFAVNGKISSAETYDSHDLFQKLWPKLLRSSAVEAVSNLQQGKVFPAPGLQAVRASVLDAGRGRASSRDVNTRTSVVTTETGNGVLFETRDNSTGHWVHRSYIAR